MKRFKNILVGVDLSAADRLYGSEPGPTTRSAIDRALELAQQNSARVTLAFALDVSERARFLIDHTDGEERNGARGEIHAIMENLEKPFRDAGVEVDHQITIGPSWLELIYHVLRANHDLVIIGSRAVGPLERFFLGSTGIKLLRKCPCPVWVVKGHDQHKVDSVLVANDLSPISNQAMELGCSMADISNAELHILHALEHAKEHAAIATVVATKSDDENFREIAEQEIEAQLKQIAPTTKANVHIIEQGADQAIATALDEHKVDLLVMGTISRTGIPGYLIGNTAERLLPYLNCSVLAIKPEGFVSPIHL